MPSPSDKPVLKKRKVEVVGVKWTAIILTCQSINSAHAFQRELEARQKKGYISSDVVLLTVEDPDTKVGSGGATLNALLVAAEHLGARASHKVLSSEILHDAYILIMHMGRNFPFDPCGRAFMTLPMCSVSDKHAELPVCNFDALLHTMTSKVAVNSPPGVWVCSTDMLLDVPSEIGKSEFVGQSACVLTMPATKEYAQHHGVYKINEQGYVRDLVYRGTPASLAQCADRDGMVSVVSGVVFFTSAVAEDLLNLNISGCTYIGLDSGAPPIQLSLFFDLLLTMCSDVSRDAFVTGERSGFFGSKSDSSNNNSADVQTARASLWKKLSDRKLKSVTIADGCYKFMDLTASSHYDNILRLPLNLTSSKLWEPSRQIYASLRGTAEIGPETVIMNSTLETRVKVGSESIVCNSHLPSGVTIGSNCCVSGFRPQYARGLSHLTLDDELMLQVFPIYIPSLGSHGQALTLFGKYDDLKAPIGHRSATFCNLPWSSLFERTKILPQDLWRSNMEEEEKCLLNARLFPVAHVQREVGLREVMWLQGLETPDADALSKWRTSWRLSLDEILSCVDHASEFEWRRQLFFKIGCNFVKKTLLEEQAHGLPCLYHSACVDDTFENMLTTLDQVASDCDSPGIAARALANIAAVLACIAGGVGGMRSGPAANVAWKPAFQLLEAGHISEGVAALATERENWLDRADRLVRAARHYEGAAQILIRHAVMTARQFIKTTPCELPAIGKWVIGEAPARADLSGGWSDTPPITYEHGGAVANIALLIDGKKPIGSKARRIAEPHVILHVGPIGTQTIVLNQLEDFADYCKPSAPGSLLKAAFCCAEVIQYPSDVSLHDQLLQNYGGGFELCTWSNLPQGSGMGTSSILAGVVMAVLWKTSGKTFDTSALMHSVLHLEQMLTTGGGWQDQVGGLTAGAKVGHSLGHLPLHVDIKELSLSSDTINALNQQFVMVYTGTPRLAKNLLQNVVRNWYARSPDIVDIVDQLEALGWKCGEALEQGDLEALGECIDTYWNYKKILAPGSEPTVVTRMLAALRPHLHGASLAGAGGGGFLYMLLKDGSNSLQRVKDILSTVQGAEHATVHTATVDMEGLTIHMED